MGFFVISLCVLIVCGTAKGNKGDLFNQEGFNSLWTNSTRLSSNGTKQQSGILNQGVLDQIPIVNHIQAWILQTSEAIENVAAHAAEIFTNVAERVLLNGASAFIIAFNKQNLSLPDINIPVLGIGSFVANGGEIGDVSTLNSNGPVKLRKLGSSLWIEIPIRMGPLNAGYGQYSFTILGISLHGTINASIGKIALLIELQLFGYIDCIINLQKIEVQTIDDINVELKPILNSNLNSAIDISTFFLDIIKSEVQDALDLLLSTFLNNNNKLICSRFTPLYGSYAK